MEETRNDRIRRFADIHANARCQAGKSQEFMAMELGVSKKTVQNWEKGISSPSFFQSVEWFRILKINPFRDYLSVLYPSIFEELHPSSEDEQIDEAFQTLIHNIPISDKRALLYLYYGEHGSSAHSLIQLGLAYLHASLGSRTAMATIIANIFEMEQEMNRLICKENIMPDVDDLNDAIRKARIAVINNEYGYDVTDKKDGKP